MTTTTHRWAGYDFNVHKPNADWADVAGVYVFVNRNMQGRRSALYVGQAQSLRSRLSNHEQWAPALRLGANEIHATAEPSSVARTRIERAIYDQYEPPLNDKRP